MELKEKIRELLKINHIPSQAELSRQSGVSTSTISRLYNKGIAPDYTNAMALAKVLHVNPHYLMKDNYMEENEKEYSPTPLDHTIIDNLPHIKEEYKVALSELTIQMSEWGNKND